MFSKLLAVIFVFTNPLVFWALDLFNLTPEIKEESVIEKTQNSSYYSRNFLLSAAWLSNPNFLPIRDWSINEPEINTKAALVLITSNPADGGEEKKILYQKNSDQVLPIASLTKIMTALIVLENINLTDRITISTKALSAYGEMGKLVLGEELTVKNLLYALLMESSNDAAVALAEYYNNYLRTKNGPNFVDLMNQKAKKLGLTKTNFTDPSGYQPENVSTTKELVKIIQESFHAPLIWQILRTPTIDVSSTDGKISHHWVNTDPFLKRLSGVVGGKTGYTEEAEGCFVLVRERPDKDYLISIVLGAQKRFLETEKLIKWVEKAYRW